MRVDDGAELVGRRELGQQRAPRPAPAPPAPPHRPAPSATAAAVEIERGRTRLVVEPMRAQPRADADARRRVARSWASAGSTRLSDSPSRGTSGAAGRAARAQGLAQDRRRAARAEPALGLGVERGDRQRLPQAAIEHRARSTRSVTTASAARAAGAAPRDSRRRPVPATRRAGDEDPPRHACPRSAAAPSARRSRDRGTESARVRPVSVSRAPIASQISASRRDCRRAAGGCRCRSGSRASRRDRSGSGRRPAAPAS